MRNTFVRWLLVPAVSCLLLPSSTQAAQDGQPAKVELKQLLFDLKSLDEETKLEAIINLADWGPKADAAIPGLIEALQSQNEDFRLNAAIALGAIGKKAVPALAELLASADGDTRYHAVWALGLIGRDARETAGAVIKLLADKNDDVRRKAAATLGRIAPEAKLAVPLLIVALDDKDEDVRAEAVQALARFGGEAVPALIDILKGKNAAKARQAVTALGEIGAAAKDAVPALKPWLTGADQDTIPLAAEALGKIGKASLATLVEATRHDNSATRLAAVEGLHKIGAEAAADLVDALGSKHVDVRRQAALHLAEMRINDNLVVLGLAYALKDTDDRVRLYCAHGLVQLGAAVKVAAPKLKEALFDRNANVYSNAWHALENIGDDPRPHLKKYLADKKSALRIHAAALLAVLGGGDEAAMKVLRDGLKEKDFELRLEAAAALAESGQGSKQVTAVLIEGLKSPSARVREQAVVGLHNSGEHGSPAALLLLDILQKDPETNLRQQAVYALQHAVGDPKVMLAALKKMIDTVDGKDSPRLAALQVLWIYGTEAIPLVVECFDDKDENTRRQALYALERMHVDDKHNLQTALPHLKALIKKDKDRNTRWSAVALLNRCGEGGAKELLALLRDKASDEDLLWTAYQALRNMEGHKHKVVPTLTELTGQTHDKKVRVFAVQALGRLGNDAAPALIAVLKGDKDDEVRAAAIDMVGHYGNHTKEFIPYLVAALKDKAVQVRRNAALALQRMDEAGKQALPQLTEALKDTDAEVRTQAYYALYNMRPESLPALAGHLQAGDTHTRQLTLEYCLGSDYRKKDMVPGLIACLKDANAKVRLQACKLLGQLGKDANDAVEPLRGLLQDNNFSVRSAAQTALDAIVPKKK